MRTAITLTLGAQGKAKLTAGPDVPYDKQRAAFAELRAKGLPPGAESVELWSSDGRRKRLFAAKVNLAAKA